MFKVLEVPAEVDLSQYSRLLWQARLSHRIQRAGDVQFVLVFRQEDVLSVQDYFRRWQRGEIKPAAQDSSDVAGWFQPGNMLRELVLAFMRAPFTLLLIGTCLLLFFFAPLDSFNELSRALLYPDFSFGTRTINLTRVLDNFSLLQFGKMLSPMLLHGGLVHLAFNMMWLWELGKRIEAVQASWAMFILVLTLGLISNTAQYLFGGGSNFGGMSGVVYGLFGYIWMWQLFDPAKHLALPMALIVFMLLSLLVITALDLERIANTAHVAGLLAGVVYGAACGTVSRLLRVRNG